MTHTTVLLHVTHGTMTLTPVQLYETRWYNDPHDSTTARDPWYNDPNTSTTVREQMVQ